MSGKEIVSVIIPLRNERENIEVLIQSIYNQGYRPIEVVAVDGGSTDGTLEALEELKRKLDSEDFKLKVLNESDFGSLRSQPNARNIGIMNSSGEYIIFFDADMILLDKDLTKKVKTGLDANPWVGVQSKPIIDSALEKALVAEIVTRYGSLWYKGCVHKYCGVRRFLFKKRLFDPHLGFGEDRDFFEHYLRVGLGIEPLFVDTHIGRHEPHTLKELFKQQIWYGRTIFRYAQKHYSRKDAIKLVLRPLISATLLLLILITLASGLYALTLAFIVFFGIRRIRFCLKISEEYRHVDVKRYDAFLQILFCLKIPEEYRHPKILLLAMVIAYLLRPLAYAYGVVQGLAKLLPRQESMKWGRD